MEEYESMNEEYLKIEEQVAPVTEPTPNVVCESTYYNYGSKLQLYISIIQFQEEVMLYYEKLGDVVSMTDTIILCTLCSFH